MEKSLHGIRRNGIRRNGKIPLQHFSVDVDAFITAYLGLLWPWSLTFDLQKSNQVISRGWWIFLARLVQTAQVAQEIWCSQDLTSTACFEPDR